MRRIFAAVFSLTRMFPLPVPLSTAETAGLDTPATWAMSIMRARFAAGFAVSEEVFPAIA